MYIVYNNEKDVTAIYYNPVPSQLAVLQAEEITGVHMDGEVPQPDSVAGLQPKLKLDVDQIKLYYDYERPDTLDNRVYQLQQDNERLKQDNAKLMIKLAEKGVL